MFAIRRQVSSSDADSSGKAYLHAVMNYMLDVCFFHQEALAGFRQYFRDNGFGIFLLSWQADILDMPRFGEKLSIEDSIYDVESIYGKRVIEARDESRRLRLICHGIGVFVDLKTGRPVKRPAEFRQLVDLDPQLPMDIQPRRIALPEGTPDSTFELAVPRSFIDLNGHMNSDNYIRLADDLLPAEFAYDRLRVEYRMQAKQGEKIRFERISAADRYFVRVVSGENSTLLTALEFSRRAQK